MLPIVKQDGWRLQVAQTKLSTHFPLVKIAFELFGSDHAGVCFGLAKCWFQGCTSFLPTVGYFSKERTWCLSFHLGGAERVLFWTKFRSDYYIYKVLPLKPNMLSVVYAGAIPQWQHPWFVWICSQARGCMWYKIHCQHLEATDYPLRFCSHASKCGKCGDVFVNLTGSWSALQPCSNLSLSKVSIAFIVS